MVKRSEAKVGDILTLRVYRWAMKKEVILDAGVVHATRTRLTVEYDPAPLKAIHYSGSSKPQKMTFTRDGVEYPRSHSWGRSFNYNLMDKDHA